MTPTDQTPADHRVTPVRSRLSRKSCAVFYLAFFCLLSSSLRAAPRPVVFASFEDPGEVAAWQAEGGAALEASSDFVAWFDRSLKATFPAGGLAGVGTGDVPADWHLHEAFRFFCYSPLPAELVLTLTDRQGMTALRRIHLKRGSNHVQLELAGLYGINLREMAALRLSLPAGLGETTVYLDRFSLDSFNHVLDSRGRMDISYSREVATPHVPWALPLAEGPVRALFVPDVINGRAVIELAQRLDLDFKATTLGGSYATNIWGFGDFYGMRGRTRQESPTAVFSLAYTYLADELLNGPHYDLIVIPGARPWGEYPAAVRQEIRRRVADGCGLVLAYPYFDPDYDNRDLAELSPLIDVEKVVGINPNNFLVEDSTSLNRVAWEKSRPHYITRNVPLEAFPFGQMHYARCRAAGEVLLECKDPDRTPILAVRSFGKGRVAAFSYGERGMIPRLGSIWQVEAEYPYWEYFYSLLIRSMVWAAGRESEAAVESIGFSEAGVAKIQVAGPPNDQDRVLEVVFRDGFGRTVDSTRVAVPPSGRGTLKVSYPGSGPRGTVLVDTRLLERQKVLDWGSLVAHLQEDTSVDSIVFSAGRFRPGEMVAGEVFLTRRRGKRAELCLELRDNYGRLLDTLGLQLGSSVPPKVSFRLDPQGALSHLIRVDCVVKAGGHQADRRRAEVFFQRGAVWDDYDVVMYLFGPDPMPGLWPTIESRLKQLHTTTLSSYPLELCKYANFSVQAQTRISGQESPDGELRDYYDKMKKDYLSTGDKHLLVREYCLNDPKYLEDQVAELKELCAPWVPFSPMSYYIYEEPSLTCYGDACDICFSPHCMAAMRKWLANEYGTLERLNEVWETSFNSWEEVEPDDAVQAQARGNYASWADHRTFMEVTYAGNCDHVARTLREIDPTGIVLNSGTQIVGSHNGCDYWRLDKIFGHLNPYSGDNQMDFHRTFGEGLKLSAGMGYGRSGREVPYGLYSNLFDGSWAGSYVFWQYSMLDPDLTFCQSALDTRDGFDEMVGSGIARLFKNLPRGHDNIAIHYSMASAHGTWITDGKVARQVTYNTSRAFDRFREDRDGWVSLLKDLGHQYDFLAYEEIEKGALEQGGYKVLIMPMSVALSDAEAEAVRRFVQGGGTLVSDRFAGVMDSHCRWRAAGALDDVLGLERTRKPAPGDFTAEGPDPDLKSRGAEAAVKLNGLPAGWTHAYGRGRAFTLGYLLDNYVAEARDNLAGRHRELVSGALAAAGVQPMLKLTTSRGVEISGVASSTFDNGDCTLIGLVRSNEGPLNELEVLVRLPGERQVYDVRRSTCLGYSDRVLLRLSTGEPAVLALLPGKLAGPVLEAPETATRGSEFSFRVQVPGSPEMHDVAVVELITPSGERHELYSTRIDLDRGRGRGAFTPALDDPAGVWKLQVREVIGGGTAEALFVLED